MAQNKNSNSKKNSLESVLESVTNKTIARLNAKTLHLASNQKILIGCLVSIKKKLSSENIPINNLITEIVKTLQEVNNNN